MVNAGCHPEAAATEQLFVDNFAKYDVIVAPSGSCIHQVRDNLTAIEQTPAVRHVRENSYELVEYLHDVLGVREFPWARFAHRVGYHDSCNTLRNLGHGQPSELRGGYFSKPRALLEAVDGIELVTPDRPDECCGFGGTFSVTEPEVSGRMGHDKVADHGRAGAAYIVSADTSCLMHPQGCAKRIGAPVAFKHIAEILNGDTA